ncbi:exonuclease domain-containing protein [Actinoplanes sp. NPDC049599]|jgi:DNA polymerase-3 subunit epsilon|uniref:exonuclease domain-containing protein n=1 Tax=Actinoplanes sp. NPDC049599 TaxID=3363903 RepID=UPI003788803E
MYAVIDVETTGLRASWHDRIVEIAVVHLDERGRVQDEWCSLINPDRDLGPQHIHGISAAEAGQAPTFAQLAGQVSDLLRGRTLVAHNLAFDALFLAAEFRHLGHAVPVDARLGLCTMQLAPHFLPSAGRSLHDCRRAAGLPGHRAHSALHDAHAAADLLAHYLTITGTPPPWTPTLARCRTQAWPTVPPSTAAPVRRRSPGSREPHFLTRLADRLPRQQEPRADAYLDLLDQTLLDRDISATEAEGLVTMAEALGLGRADARSLHRRYLTGLATVALADGILTPAERQDLERVADLVGLPASAVERVLADAARHPAGANRRFWQLERGDVVVFTETMAPDRERWQADAEAAGLVVGEAVSKKTRLLIAADPESMSGTAKKARQYGVPVVHPQAYRTMLESLLQPV